MQKKALLKKFVHSHQDIRAVGVEGSIATGKTDCFSDIDVTFFTTIPEHYLKNDVWLDFLGPRIIMQKPGIHYLEDGRKLYPYLMLFENGERVDLKIAAVDTIEAYLQSESTAQIILDLDNRVKRKVEPNESSFFLKKPTEEEFLEVVNEFFWVIPYVVKGCARKQFLYAVQHLAIIRDQLIQVISWGIAEKYHGEVNLGSHQKYLQKYLDEETWEILTTTYNCKDYGRIIQSLLLLIELMEKEAKKLANLYEYAYLDENEQVIAYVKEKIKEMH
ncbi:MAG: aminoglycoside 6-adenylyltransferase [Kurthia sp.]|nr:aminoglycoside 6-adenylyltransferase [Candidatus Kurthia equi]